MGKNISLIISDICRTLDIPYTSVNKEVVQLYNDAKRLGEIWLELESFADELDCICKRHNIEGIEKLLNDDIEAIGKIEHDLRNIAFKIKNEDKLKKEKN